MNPIQLPIDEPQLLRDAHGSIKLFSFLESKTRGFVARLVKLLAFCLAVMNNWSISIENWSSLATTAS